MEMTHICGEIAYGKHEDSTHSDICFNLKTMTAGDRTALHEFLDEWLNNTADEELTLDEWFNTTAEELDSSRNEFYLRLREHD